MTPVGSREKSPVFRPTTDYAKKPTKMDFEKVNVHNSIGYLDTLVYRLHQIF